MSFIIRPSVCFTFRFFLQTCRQRTMSVDDLSFLICTAVFPTLFFVDTTRHGIQCELSFVDYFRDPMSATFYSRISCGGDED